MNFTKKELPKGLLEITVTMPYGEIEPYLKKTAEHVSQTKKIEGFRPGKAPYEVIVRTVGEMFLLQTAAGMAIETTLETIVNEEKIDAVAEPKVEVQKLAPNNDFEFKATFSLLPQIKLADLKTLKVKLPEEIKIEEKEIDKVLNDLKKFKAKDVIVEKKAEKGDKVIMSLNVYVDNVPIEGGQAPAHTVTIGEGMMIPGFEDNLLGLQAGEEKEFRLKFPKEYHEKNLADKEAEFKVKITSVAKIELPEIDDEFAKAFGLPDVENFRKNIANNLRQEKENKENQKFELAIFEELLEKSEFSEIPEVLINEETHRMVHELEDNVARQGMKFEDYLNHIKKTEADLMLDFTVDAIKRVKTGLAVRQLALEKEVKATEEEITAEKEKTVAGYKLNPQYEGKIDEVEKSLSTPQALQYFANIIRNRKTLELLKNTIKENQK